MVFIGAAIFEQFGDCEMAKPRKASGAAVRNLSAIAR